MVVVHLSHGVNSQESSHGELPYHSGHSSTTGLVSLHCSLSPWTFVMHPASGSYPPLTSCPVHISYQLSGLSLPCLHVIHIYSNPTKWTPQQSLTSTYKLRYFIFSNKTKTQQQFNSRLSPLMYPLILHVSAPLTYTNGSLPLYRLV